MTESSTALFDEMATDLSACRPEIQDQVLCPMCLRQVGRDEIKTLGKEHVVSESLGGRTLTLTCEKQCNNDFGHKAESHLNTLFKMNEAFRGCGDFRGSFTLADQRVPVRV